VSDIAPGAGLIDTSVLVSPEHSTVLPTDTLISMVTLAELAAGPHATEDTAERARRQARLQAVEAGYDSLPFDVECARAYGRVYAEVLRVGRKARGGRALDLFIAATAVAHELALYTYNAADFRGLESILNVVDCRAATG
jgi:hypothetical protein